MTEHSIYHKNQPVIFKILAVLFFLFGLAALFGSLFLWGEGFVLSFPEGVDLGLPVADILINAPASILTAIGLWGMRKWGKYMAWFTAGFYLYASVEIFAHYAQLGELSNMAITLPQAVAVLAAVVVMVVSWKYRDRFTR